MLLSQLKYSVAPAILATLCYLNSLSGDLVHDDVFAIKDNEDLRPNTPLSSLLLNDFWGEPMASPTSHKSYRPLTVFGFRLNYLLHGLDPWGYHLVNVLLHVLTTVLLGWFCRREVFRGMRRRSHDGWWSLVVMLLFASHPIHTEAVSGVVGRADVLACLLFLVSVLFYCSSTRCSSWSPMMIKLCVAMVASGAAMLCKEHGATVLGVCLVYDLLLVDRNLLCSIWKGNFRCRDHTRALVRAGVVIATTLLLLVLRVSLLYGHLPHFSAQDNPASFSDSMLTRMWTYGYLAYFNCKLLFFPSVLCYDWQMGSIPLVQSLADPRNVLTLLLFLYMAALLYSSLWRWPSPSGGVRGESAPLWGLILLVTPYLPASNLFLRVGFVVAERILYLPSVGWCILVVVGLQRLWRSPRLRPFLFSLLLLLVLLFSLKTIARNPVWTTRQALFRSALGTVPGNAKVSFNYANYLKDSGRGQEAVQYYRTAISLAPDHSVSHNNLGSLLAGKEAEFHFRQAVLHNPRHYKAFFNLGNNLQQQGRLDEAVASYRESLRIEPAYVQSKMSLASALFDTGGEGQEEEGLALMRGAVKLDPLNANVHHNLGTLLSRQGKGEEAMSAYEEAVRLSPHHCAALTSLGRLHRSLGHTAIAEQTFRRALSVSAESSTYLSLASMLFNTGRIQEAIHSFNLGLELNPDNTDLLCGLVQALLQENHLAESLKRLEEGFRVWPDTPCLHYGMGMAQLKIGQLQLAVDHLQLSANLSMVEEEVTGSLHLLGGALKDLGRLDEAEEVYRRAVSIAPKKAHLHMNLGAILHLKRDYDPAMAAYQQALLLDPDSVILKENIKKLKRAAAGSHQGSNVLKETSKERGSSGRKTQKSVANNAATERT